MKLLPLVVLLIGAVAPGWAWPAPLDGESETLLTEVDEDISRWNGLGRDGSDQERQDLKQEMGGRLDRFSNTFGRGFGPIGAGSIGVGALGGGRGAAMGVHRALVYRAIRTLDRAAEVDPDDYELASSVAAAYIAVAQVQGHPSHPNLGYTRESAATYAKATRILARVQRQAPDYGRGRSLASQARTSVYAYSQYPWYEPEVFVFVDLSGKEPGAPIHSEPRSENNYGGAVGPGRRQSALGDLVEEIVQAEGDQILAAFAGQPASSEGLALEDVRARHAIVQGKAEAVWNAAKELHDSLAAEGGLRSEAIRYLARLQVFLEEATAGLEASDAGRAKANLTRAEYEIDRLGKIVGVRP